MKRLHCARPCGCALTGIDAHAREAGDVGRVDKRVEIRHDVAFDVVLPRDDAQTPARTDGLHDGGDAGQGDEVEAALPRRLIRELCGRLHGGLMRERAFRPEIEQGFACHRTPL